MMRRRLFMLRAGRPGNAPQALPDLVPFNVEGTTQGRLRAVANEQLKLINGRQYCPNDVLL